MAHRRQGAKARLTAKYTATTARATSRQHGAKAPLTVTNPVASVTIIALASESAIVSARPPEPAKSFVNARPLRPDSKFAPVRRFVKGERIQEEMREAARAREEAREREAAQAREEARTREELRENGAHPGGDARGRSARQEAARAREELRERARILEQQEREATRDELLKATAQTRNELGEVHTRLDRLSQQLERLAQPEAVPRPRVMPQSPAPQISAATSDERTPRLTGAPMPPPRRDLPEPQRNRPASLDSPAGDRRSRNGQDLSIEDAVAEITARQRALASGTAVASPPKPPVIAPVKAALPDASPPAAPEIVAAPKASTPDCACRCA